MAWNIHWLRAFHISVLLINFVEQTSVLIRIESYRQQKLTLQNENGRMIYSSNEKWNPDRLITERHYLYWEIFR